LATVSGLDMPEDGRSAHVRVSVEGDDAEAERTLAGLDAAKNFIRHELAERLRLRRAPELFFRVDRSQQLESRVDELLSRAKKRSKK
jgi:ribosome-binding factor A